MSEGETNPPKQESKSQIPKSTKLFAVLIVILVGVVLIATDFSDIQSFIFGEEQPKETLGPSDVELYLFNDPFDNNSVNVEFWLINIGEETAKDIEVYVRVRDPNGSILYSEMVDTTTLLLRANETCSGWYMVSYDGVLFVTHTIEVSWDTGRNSYNKKTMLITTTP